ncbi:MAG TPA: alkaline phosphatase, partial [Flavobacteriaceae bacterium]|nr:alkaline phosphatase [Flavobacteriaceae bacterium]
MYAKNCLRFTALYFFLFVSSLMFAQKATESEAMKAPTKLVVGVVVDQMRYDYLTRFWDQYSEGGFKRLVHGGFVAKNHHFNYAPTSTGPGHASVYTGTTPATHGIIGNDFFDIASGSMVYCAGDDQYASVGVSSDEGKMSPHRLLTSTMTDQLRLHYKNKAKVISISVKDRGAVLPGGHMANAAYWFVGGEQGLWVTSTYYMDALPKWVADFNAQQSIAQYKKPWNLLYNEKKYDLSVADDNLYEGPFKGEQKPVFPHDLPALWNQNGGYGILRATPYGNSMLTDFALEALKQEDLGQDKTPDFLAISYSSTDYVGHQFGVDSKEVQDTYLRLDLEIARLLKALDRQVGTGQYTLFLTADHAAIPVPAYLQDQKIPAGYVEANAIKQGIDQFVQDRFGAGLVS